MTRWEHIQKLKDEMAHELLSSADVKSFLQTCQDVKAQLQDRLLQLDTPDVGSSPSALQAEEQRQAQAERDIEALERKIEYLKSVAKMWVCYKIISVPLIFGDIFIDISNQLVNINNNS